MKQWVVGLAVLALCATAGLVAAQDEEKAKKGDNKANNKEIEKSKDKDKGKDKGPEVGPKPKVEQNNAAPPATESTVPCHGISYPCTPCPPAHVHCEYVPCTVWKEVEECCYVPVPKKEKCWQTYCELVCKKVPSKHVYCKLVEVRKKQQIKCWEPVCREIEREYCCYEPCERKIKRKCIIYVPCERKETRYCVECVPFCRKEERVGCYTVYDHRCVTRFCEQIVSKPSDGCDPHPTPIVCKIPYTTYECVPRKVEYKYCVEVKDCKWVKKPYDVIICELKPVEKEEEITICEYVKKVYRKKEKCTTWEWVCKEIEVCCHEYRTFEEPCVIEVCEYVTKKREVWVETCEYKLVKKVVKKPCTQWVLKCTPVCDPVPCPPHHHHHHAPSVVVPNPTCY